MRHIQLMEEISKRSSSELLILVTSTDIRAHAAIEHGMLQIISSHLYSLSKKYLSGQIPKLSLLLNTNGGNIPTAHAIVMLIRQFAKKFEVIIPDTAMSAGTLLALGADEIVMTRQAKLGPIDPSILPMKTGGKINICSSQDFKRSFEHDLLSSSEKKEAFLRLFKEINPIILGQALRAQEQVQNMVNELIEGKVSQEFIPKVQSILTGGAVQHDYPISREEAIERLSLPVRKAELLFEDLVLELYRLLDKQLSPPSEEEVHNALLQQKQFEVCFSHFIIESLGYGSDRKILTGTITKEGMLDKCTSLRHLELKGESIFID